MKKLLCAFGALALFCACDVTELEGRMDDLEDRVTSLEALCETMNVNIASLQKFVSAHEENLFVESITELSNGFTITLSNGKTFQIVNGEKGGKGDKGEPGAKGDTGTAPAITIGVFEGVSYWKVNNEWVLSDGKKVSAVGVTPQMKIEGKKWMISYDAGATWNEVAAAYDESAAITVTQDEDAVYLELHDGTKFSLPKVPGFKFRISEVADICLPAGETKDFPYTISKGDGSVVFTVQGECYAAKVIPTDVASGVVRVTAPSPAAEGWVLVTAVQNSTGEMKGQCMKFVRGGVSVVMDAQTVDVLGGVAKVALKTNTDYTVIIPDEAKDWISYIEPTKSFRVDTLKFNILPNYTALPRQETVSVVPTEGETINFVVSQDAGDVTPEFGVTTESPIAVDYKSCTAVVNVTGTVLWTLELPAGLTASKMSGAGQAEITVNIPANESVTPATYVLKVKTTNDVVPVKEFAITVNQAGTPDPNDYYAQFLAGQDITIGGKVFNITNYPVYTLTKMYEWTNNNFMTYEKHGIVFLDYDSADGKADTFQSTSNLKPENVVVIGRYRNHQPVLTFSGTNTIYPTKQFVAFKNIRFEMGNYCVATTSATGPFEIHMEDCSLITSFRYAFAQSNATLPNNISKIVLYNSVVSCPFGLFGIHSNIPDNAVLSCMTGIDVRNTVISAPSTSGYPCVNLGVKNYSTPNADFVFDHCTFNNIYGGGYGLLSMYSAKSVRFDDNVACCEPAKNTVFVYFRAVQDPKIEGSVTGNRIYSSNATVWAVETSAMLLTNSGLSVSDNNCYANDSPFASNASLENIYLPVDKLKVTNGAGASYETKLWKSWE